MAIEARRGCGYRKCGGLYLVASGSGMPCGRLPIPLDVCPTCHQGIKQARGWTWIDVPALVKDIPCKAAKALCALCPLSTPETIGKAGLLWVGEKFYKTPEAFNDESNKLGISRRIKAIPRGFKVGETWVLLAHSKGLTKQCPTCNDENFLDCQDCGGKTVITVPAVFRIFKPEAVEKLITESQATPEELKKLEKDDIRPVVVPDGDKDHRGSVYDKDEDTDDES